MRCAFLLLSLLVLPATTGSAQDDAPPARVLIVTGVDYKGLSGRKQLRPFDVSSNTTA